MDGTRNHPEWDKPDPEKEACHGFANKATIHRPREAMYRGRDKEDKGMSLEW